MAATAVQREMEELVERQGRDLKRLEQRVAVVVDEPREDLQVLPCVHHHVGAQSHQVVVVLQTHRLHRRVHATRVPSAATNDPIMRRAQKQHI